MSQDRKTTPPATGNGTAPACTATQPCPNCWPADYDKEISIHPAGRYYKRYKADGTTEIPFNVSTWYKIYVPMKTGTDLTVEVRFLLQPDTGVTAAEAATAKANLDSGVPARWNGKFKLIVTDPLCPSKTFNIVFKPVWVTSGQHYTVKVHATYPREGVTGPVMDVSKATLAWTFGHEFGHCYGLPDEYSYSTNNEQVKYYKPDGTLDAAINAPPIKPATAPGATVMASFGNTTTLPRHAWNIAIEAQDLLKQKLGRNITCAIQ